MTARIIDGRAVADDIRGLCATRVAGLVNRTGVTPGLAVILVGEDPASQVYVANKIKACGKAGIRSFSHRLDAAVSNKVLIDLINRLNDDDEVHGILVQLPLPPHIDMRQHITRGAYPNDFDCALGDDPDLVLMRGGSMIVAPLGTVLAGPDYSGETILYADIEPNDVVRGKYDFDVAGHYARPDIFSLSVNVAPQRAVKREGAQ